VSAADQPALRTLAEAAPAPAAAKAPGGNQKEQFWGFGGPWGRFGWGGYGGGWGGSGGWGGMGWGW